MLVEFVQSIIDSINSGGIPVIENSWKYIMKNECIKNSKELINKFISEINQYKDEISKLEKLIESMKTNRELYTKKTQNVTKKAALELNIERLRNDYKDFSATKKEYDANSEAIDKNNAIDIQIRNNDIIIRNKRNTRDSDISKISNNEATIKNHEQQIKDRKELIKRLAEEEILIRNWKIYLDLVGKNGISKMVLRKTLPIINARLSQLLNDVCDFDVEVGINLKNDVMFYLIKDGVRSDLQGASGFELTAAALALRAVLADVSMIPRSQNLVLDEVWGRVAVDNFENMKRLIEKIGKSYETIFMISHHSELVDWCDSRVMVSKENNVSTVKLLK
jgi:DNA repair exonuclease SbcCD ATPase subunit